MLIAPPGWNMERRDGAHTGQSGRLLMVGLADYGVTRQGCDAWKMVSGLILWRANDFHWRDGQRIILVNDLHIGFHPLVT